MVMSGTPLQITLYDARTHEETRRLTQVFTRWAVVKAAIRFTRETNSQAMSGPEQEMLAGLIAEAFDRRVEAEEIRAGMSLLEMVTALNTILAKVVRAGASSNGAGSSQVGAQADEGDWLIELESSLVRVFGWSLHEIDETAVESLLPFVLRGLGHAADGIDPALVHCDEVSWL